MRFGARSGLVALFLALALPAAAQQATGGGWTDPPSRRPDGDKPAAEPPRAETQAAPPSTTPAAAPRVAAPKDRPAARREAQHEARRERTAARPAPSPRRRIAASERSAYPSPRIAHGRPPRFATALPPEPVGRFYGYRPYGYAPVYEADDRLERLNSAAAAGYIVVRRRSVEFPDGRSLRVYRPVEDD